MLENGLLRHFFCTLIDQPDRRWQRWAKTLAKPLGIDLGRDLKRRAVTEVPMSMVRTYPSREVLRMLTSRVTKNELIDDTVFHWARDGFDQWVANQLEGMDGLYGYEYGALAMFKRAKESGLRTFYDLPSPEHDFVERLLAPEFDRFPELKTPYRHRIERLHAERTERRRQEWEMSDLVVTNSRFTADSWNSAGWGAKPVAIIPYGAPPVSAESEPPIGSGPLRCLWAGTFSVRKGAHYLIDAVRELKLKPDLLTIDVYGAVTLPESLLAKVPENIRFKGSVPRPELLVAMGKSDLLLFPTLCDGFGLVANEAFSQGLPVLTTARAGAADLIRPGVNGWLVEPGDAAALAAGINRVMDERTNLPAMREAARSTAAEWQWSDYRRAVAAAVAAQMASPMQNRPC